MKLVKVEINHFKNILNSGQIQIQPDVTCIIGKNESGKTAVWHALHRFNPAQPNVTFNVQRQYPAWLEKQHRRQRNLDVDTPVTCWFTLEDPEWAMLEGRLGIGALKSREIAIMRAYENKFKWDINLRLSEHIIVAHIVKDVSLDERPVPTNMMELAKLIDDLRKSSYEDETKPKPIAI
jgi:ABC-type branched-subunit amino acid transport system ATPase component